MPHAILSPAAQREMASILLWSEEHFGEAAHLRYEALLIQAIDDLAVDPLRTGSEDRVEIAEGLRSYHLWHSRNRVAQSPRRVRRPRHLFLFRLNDNGAVEIVRVLHDSMDLPRHLPESFPPSSEGDDAE